MILRHRAEQPRPRSRALLSSSNDLGRRIKVASVSADRWRKPVAAKKAENSD